jgi:hypothetical protein
MTNLFGANSLGGQAPSGPQSRYILPQFTEQTSYGVKTSDPYNKLFEERIIFLGSQVDDVSANDLMAQLLVLESQDPDRDITMYINSPGGSFTALMAIYDTMQYVRADISTGCFGSCCASRRWYAGQALRASQLAHSDSPAGHGWHPGSGFRSGDPGRGDRAYASAHGEHAVAAHG